LLDRVNGVLVRLLVDGWLAKVELQSANAVSVQSLAAT